VSIACDQIYYVQQHRAFYKSSTTLYRTSRMSINNFIDFVEPSIKQWEKSKIELRDNYSNNSIDFDIKFRQICEKLIKNSTILIESKFNNICLKLLVKLKSIIRRIS
jgi:hypothetical protein